MRGRPLHLFLAVAMTAATFAQAGGRQREQLQTLEKKQEMLLEIIKEMRSQMNEMREQLSRLEHSGGGDEPTAKPRVRSRTRVVAPPDRAGSESDRPRGRRIQLGGPPPGKDAPRPGGILVLEESAPHKETQKESRRVITRVTPHAERKVELKVLVETDEDGKGKPNVRVWRNGKRVEGDDIEKLMRGELHGLKLGNLKLDELDLLEDLEIEGDLRIELDDDGDWSGFGPGEWRKLMDGEGGMRGWMVGPGGRGGHGGPGGPGGPGRRGDARPRLEWFQQGDSPRPGPDGCPLCGCGKNHGDRGGAKDKGDKARKGKERAKDEERGGDRERRGQDRDRERSRDHDRWIELLEGDDDHGAARHWVRLAEEIGEDILEEIGESLGKELGERAPREIRRQLGRLRDSFDDQQLDRLAEQLGGAAKRLAEKHLDLDDLHAQLKRARGQLQRALDPRNPHGSGADDDDEHGSSDDGDDGGSSDHGSNDDDDDGGSDSDDDDGGSDDDTPQPRRGRWL